jgi:hypothetical protein
LKIMKLPRRVSLAASACAKGAGGKTPREERQYLLTRLDIEAGIDMTRRIAS